MSWRFIINPFIQPNSVVWEATYAAIGSIQLLWLFRLSFQDCNSHEPVSSRVNKASRNGKADRPSYLFSSLRRFDYSRQRQINAMLELIMTLLPSRHDPRRNPGTHAYVGREKRANFGPESSPSKSNPWRHHEIGPVMSHRPQNMSFKASRVIHETPLALLVSLPGLSGSHCNLVPSADGS